MPVSNHYEVLGVPAQASAEQIKARYFALLQEFKAKLASGAPGDPARLAEIKAAYQTLGNPESRREYDSLPRKAGRTPTADGMTARARPEDAGQDGHAWRGSVPAWKLFWLFLFPMLLVVLALDSGAGRLWLALLRLLLPGFMVTGAVLAILVLGAAAAFLLWRRAFNVERSVWGYGNRLAAGLTLLLAASVAYDAMQPGPPPGASASRTAREFTGKTAGETLLLAAKNGDVARVERALAERVDVHTRQTGRTNTGRTALHYAAGGTQYAATGNHAAVIRLLLAKGADVNAQASGGYTPLHVASGLGQKEIAELLLESGADPNALDARGTPLHAAVIQGHKEIVSLLLKNGAEANGPDPGRTPPLSVLADIAVWHPAHDEIVEMLVDNGASLSRPEGRRDARPILEIALKRDRKKLAVLLIDRGAPVDDAAVWFVGSDGQRELAEHLLGKGVQLFDRSDAGTALLHGATCSSDPKFFEWVLANTQRVDQQDKAGKTPLHIAVSCGNESSVEKLVARGANVQLKDARGRPPIAELIKPGKSSLVDSLLKAGADPNEVWDGGNTPLMSAAYLNDSATAKLLLAYGADVNKQNRYGRTALHEAARLNKLEVAQALTSTQAINLQLTDAYGKTALDLAREAGASKLVEVLLAKGGSKSLGAPTGKTGQGSSANSAG